MMPCVIGRKNPLDDGSNHASLGNCDRPEPDDAPLRIHAQNRDEYETVGKQKPKHQKPERPAVPMGSQLTHHETACVPSNSETNTHRQKERHEPECAES